MDVNKEVEFRRRKTKIITGGVVATVLLLGAVVFMAVYFSRSNQKPTRLVEIDLKEGESLTYRVDQHIEMHGSDGPKVSIRAIVGIRVLNKTFEEYWFLMKSNLSQLAQNATKKDQNLLTDYFLVHLHMASRKWRLIELTKYFEEGEMEKARVHLFVRLSLPKSEATISLKENPHNFSTDAVSNSSLTPPQNPLVNQTHNSTNSSSTLLQRSRRSSNLEVDQSATLFEKKVLGITVKAKVKHWVQQGVKMGISVVLSIGSYNEPILNKEYTWNELQNQQPTDSSISWSIASLSFSIPVIMVFSIGVDFSLKFKLGLSKSYPQSLSSSSREVAVQVTPHAEVTAEIDGYLSALVIKAGVYGDGTIVRVGLPVTLSLQVYPSESFCTTMSADLTALKLSASLYYQSCGLFSCGSRKTILRFGTWDDISRNWKLMPTRCN